MKFCSEIYGADADNKRGIVSINYEIEESDKSEICEKLYDRFISGENAGKHNVFMYCHIKDEEIEVEVNIEDYIEDLIKMAQDDENLKEDDEFQKWIKELKEAQDGK